MSPREAILSNDYADYIFEYQFDSERTLLKQYPECIKIINYRYGVVYTKRTNNETIRIADAGGYNYIPKLYALSDSTGMDPARFAGDTKEKALKLQGEDVIIGFIDTGIDYQNPVFLDEFGNSKIIGIWDQTIQTGSAPAGMDYGSEYRSELIDQALASQDPLNLVPSVDEDGHGTFIAGIAAGSPDYKNDFSGVAGRAKIAMVKLKPAKQYLRDFYLIKEDAAAYSETDIMLGIRYLLHLQEELVKPLVICIGLGTTYGDHTGNGPLGAFLGMISKKTASAVVIGTGNEVNKGLHYSGHLDSAEVSQDVEILVPHNSSGFILELWYQEPERYQVGFIPPTGELLFKQSDRLDSDNVYHIKLEQTSIYINDWITEPGSGGQLIFMRFHKPRPGIWRIRIRCIEHQNGVFHMWLPHSEFITPGTSFVKSDPLTTAACPSHQENIISVGAYDHQTNRIYEESGKGPSRSGHNLPDVMAPGVNVYGPAPGGRYVMRTGTSVAAAHAAGAAACMMEWGFYHSGQLHFDSDDVKRLIIDSAAKNADLFYPDKDWGYGVLNLSADFESEQNDLIESHSGLIE